MPQFKVATYNVWFGSDRKGAPYPEERMKAIGEIITTCNNNNNAPNKVLVCGLQEVTQSLGDTLESSLSAAGYTLLRPKKGGEFSWYGCALAVHKTLEIVEEGWIPFHESSMARGFLHVRARLPKSNKEILFTTTHLESPIDKEGKTNTRERRMQIRELDAFCNQELANHRNDLEIAIIAGDLNWDDRNAGRDVPLLEQGFETSDWKDVWLETSSDGGTGGFTYDCIANPFLDGDRQVRLDRILFRKQQSRTGSTNSILPTEARLMGNLPLAGLTIPKEEAFESADGFSTPVKTIRNVPITPSDHFGLAATFNLESSEESLSCPTM